eukprot:tig00021146_g19048.t1
MYRALLEVLGARYPQDIGQACLAAAVVLPEPPWAPPPARRWRAAAPPAGAAGLHGRRHGPAGASQQTRCSTVPRIRRQRALTD